jgi:hypothetical protein
MMDPKAAARPYRTARAGSLDSTLQALTDHVAQEQNKQVVLEISGLELIPPRYQTAIKNIAIQLIRNAVMHGIEAPEARAAANKAVRGTLRLDFKSRRDTFDLLFEDDGRGLNPDEVRAVAVERGVVSSDTAARLRDREAIKLIFKSRYTTHREVTLGCRAWRGHVSGASLRARCRRKNCARQPARARDPLQGELSHGHRLRY